MVDNMDEINPVLRQYGVAWWDGKLHRRGWYGRNDDVKDDVGHDERMTRTDVKPTRIQSTSLSHLTFQSSEVATTGHGLCSDRL